MTTIDKSGTSVEEIISAFRKEHQIRDWELNYEILKKPSNGIFGLFANKTAVVRFQLPAIEDRAALFTKTLLTKMGIGFDRISTKFEGKTLYLEIIGCKDPGFLIGKNGAMLETVQFLVNRVFEYDRKLDRIFLDADSYRERREEQFFRKFQPLISKIRVHGKPVTLDLMNAAERRIIHRHVERDKGLRTLTIGEGEMKRIVVFSSKQNEREVLDMSTNHDAAPAPKPKNSAPREKTQEPRKPRPNNKPQTTSPAPKDPETGKEKPRPRNNRPRNHYRPKKATPPDKP